jgi:hypothetical protein
MTLQDHTPIVQKPCIDLDTPLGILTLTLGDDFTANGELKHVITIHRVPYQVRVRFFLRMMDETWLTSTIGTRRVCPVDYEVQRYRLGTLPTDAQGQIYEPVAANPEPTRAAVRHIEAVLHPLLEAWVEKNFEMFAGGTEATMWGKIRDIEQRITKTRALMNEIEQKLVQAKAELTHTRRLTYETQGWMERLPQRKLYF